MVTAVKQSVDPTKSEPPPISESKVASPLRFLWLIGLFFVGFLLIVMLNKLFSNLIDELGARSANERARLFIGEEIVRNIQGIEMDVYRMAMAGVIQAQERIEGEFLKKVSKLEHDLAVLKDGGTVQQQIHLNVEEMEQMVREAHFKPDEQDKGYVMEIIELGPHLDQIKAKVKELRALLELREECRAQRNGESLLAVTRDILIYFKLLPSFFFRLNENANRLFFESQHRLEGLEGQLAAQRDRYKITETVLVVLVIGAVTLIGLLFAHQLKQSNDKLVRAWGEMRLARDEAERASRAKSDFVSRMSHELRTPMNAILGFAQLLDREALTPVQRDYSQRIHTAGEHLLDLIGEVLDLAKIEAGRLVLECIAFELRQTIDEVVSVAVKRAQIKGLELKLEIAPELPSQVEGDPTRLRQVLINLLDNAVKFTERGEVGLRVELEPADGALRFGVWDTGIGMAESAVQKLFKPFTQADQSTTRKYGGTGLGLAICKDLVGAMGGVLRVVSRPGHGTQFWFSLPLKHIDLAPEPTAAVAASPAAGAEAASRRVTDDRIEPSAHWPGHVLLVEDNQVNQLVASSMLAVFGTTYEIASNGLEALEKFRQGNYDLVLMDVEMPLMDGHAATQEIRLWEQRRGSPPTPVIAMTANAMAEDRARCVASGMDDYLTKPYEMDALAAALQRWLPYSPAR
ncbi:MAG: response regulator [Candidatus Competibacteraceae bacterium]|nr:response regulator [Candidatus Competibacteraceae bacterium]MBK8962567.1 response regulator [Candidatus Competibacteraceae bacterium]MBK9951786.1 response regulator [Candidatus Competibacteraceae bacterium]